MAESPDVDPLCEDPVDEVAQQLESVTDPVLFRQYALWLVSKDADKGLAVSWIWALVVLAYPADHPFAGYQAWNEIR